ncbi:hypothetical protein Droror1_Dr00006520 [Drosera rotundifolia]
MQEENRSSYGLSSSLNSTTQKEFGNFVQEIKQETRQIRNNKNPSEMIRKNGAHLDDSNVFRSVFAIRKSYASKLEQSELHKQDLLAEMDQEKSGNDEIYDQLEQALTEAENARREGFEESKRQRKAEKDTIDAIRKNAYVKLRNFEQMRREVIFRGVLSVTIRSICGNHDEVRSQSEIQGMVPSISLFMSKLSLILEVYDHNIFFPGYH